MWYVTCVKDRMACCTDDRLTSSRRVLGFKRLMALAANQRCVRFRPGIEAAIRAGVFGLAGRFLAGCRLVARAGLPRNREPLLQELRAHPVIGAALLYVMAHALAGHLSAFGSGVGWNQADGLHHRRPFLVVIAVAGRLAEMMLLQMAHLMNERRKRLPGRPIGKRVRIERNFVGDLLAVRLRPGIAPKVPVCPPLALQSDNAGRQLAREQIPVERIVSAFQLTIGVLGGFHAGLFLAWENMFFD